jgi:hypothetical protein
MFHLINKTYLQYRENFVFGEDCIQLYDKTHDDIIYDNKVGEKFSTVDAERLHICLSVDKLSEFFGGDKAMFETFLNHKNSRGDSKIKIYSDRMQFNDFTIRFIKTLFKDMTHKDGFQLYEMHKNKMIFSSQVVTVRDTNKTDLQLHESYWYHDNKSFEKAWAAAEKFDVDLSDYVENLSIEYLIANYLLGSENERLLSSFEEKMKRNFSKQIAMEISEFKFELEESLYTLNHYFPNLSFANFYNFDWEKIVNQVPQLSFLRQYDLRFAKTFEEIEGLSSFDDLLFVFDKVKEVEDRFDKDCKYLAPCLEMFLEKGRVMPSIEELVAIELNHKKYSNHCLVSLQRLVTKQKANGYLIREIFYYKNAGLLKALAKYKI